MTPDTGIVYRSKIHGLMADKGQYRPIRRGDRTSVLTPIASIWDRHQAWRHERDCGRPAGWERRYANVGLHEVARKIAFDPSVAGASDADAPRHLLRGPGGSKNRASETT
jgi:hypothetical protein